MDARPSDTRTLATFWTTRIRIRAVGVGPHRFPITSTRANFRAEWGARCNDRWI